MKHSVKYIRKVVIGLVGGLVLIIGLILIPLPGPGFLVVFLGVFILSLEFEWFKPHVERTKKLVKSTAKPTKKKR
jgi:uncharacterized protein (TIGR02611 family)